MSKPTKLYICTKKDGSYSIYQDIPGKPSREGMSFPAGLPVAKGVKQFRESFACEETDFHYIFKNEWHPDQVTLGPVLPDLKNAEIVKIKAVYPNGTRIRLTLPMLDPDPIPVNMEGKVDFIDDGGQIHMRWNNGRTLPLNVLVDVFEVLKERMFAAQ